MSYINVFRQKNGFCGVACLQSIFYQYGVNYSQEQLAKLMNPKREKGVTAVKWIERVGSDQSDLARLCEKLKFKTFSKFDCSLEELKTNIKDNRHVVVAYNDSDWGEHYVLAFDYDDSKIVLGDPKIPGIKSMDWQNFKNNWREQEVSRDTDRGQVLVVYPRG